MNKDKLLSLSVNFYFHKPSDLLDSQMWFKIHVLIIGAGDFILQNSHSYLKQFYASFHKFHKKLTTKFGVLFCNSFGLHKVKVKYSQEASVNLEM